MSARQRQVIDRKRGGMTNPAIARELGIAVGTVARHASRAYRKLGVDVADRLDAIHSGRRNALNIRGRPVVFDQIA